MGTNRRLHKTSMATQGQIQGGGGGGAALRRRGPTT